MTEETHHFFAHAFPENFSLRELAGKYPEGKLRAHELHLPVEPQGDIFLYPFGAIVFHNLNTERQAAELARLHLARPGLSPEVVQEDFRVIVTAGAVPGFVDGVLHLDLLDRRRAGVIAQTVAQSAALEYYERIVEQLFSRTGDLAARLESRGTVALRTRPLHRFIGAAITARAEVLSVLHLLDKPEGTWDDAEMDRVYADLRREFDLVDRFRALEYKLRSIQETLELVLGVARERRLVWIEVAVVLLILLEIILSAFR